MEILFALLAASAMFGYLLGSIPFGLLLTRLAGLGDIRSIGSGNIGATNVLRTGNKLLAVLTLLLDGGKGAFAAYFAGLAWSPMGLAAGVGALIGHNFPIWLAFHGGKGVATTLGVLLVIAGPVGGAACVTWLLVAAIARISSLAALVAIGLSPVFAAIWLWWSGANDPELVWVSGFIAALVVLRHQANIRRLLAGTEPRIGRTETAEPGTGVPSAAQGNPGGQGDPGGTM